MGSGRGRADVSAFFAVARHRHRLFNRAQRGLDGRKRARVYFLSFIKTVETFGSYRLADQRWRTETHNLADTPTRSSKRSTHGDEPTNLMMGSHRSHVIAKVLDVTTHHWEIKAAERLDPERHSTFEQQAESVNAQQALRRAWQKWPAHPILAAGTPAKTATGTFSTIDTTRIDQDSSMSAPAGPASLPIELIPLILESLYDFPETFDPAPFVDLARICLVSKAFLRFGVELLYRDIRLEIVEEWDPQPLTEQEVFEFGATIRGERELRRTVCRLKNLGLHEALYQNEALRRHVRTLVLDASFEGDREVYDELEGMTMMSFTIDKIAPLFEMCQALHEVTLKGFLGLDMLYIISEITQWRRQITSLVIESSYLDCDLSLLSMVLDRFVALKDLVVYGHFEHISNLLRTLDVDSFHLEALAIGSFAQSLLPMIAKGSRTSLKSLNIEMDATGWTLGDFSLREFVNLQMITIVAFEPEDVDARVDDLKYFKTLKDVVVVIRPRPESREEAEKYGGIDLTKFPRQMRFLDLWEAPFPAATIMAYGRGTRRGTGSMIWNDELWTEEERAQVDAIWKAREG
ncbi:BZ3500_MvSof-1268-A1-R1_Chr9g10864 [Microbotryum saponariae]|uniref:BZ3500_MvSof-1268-A1-R1_Chr9g10864 protein n=1 Tax=Microbotryum saponariae TaxID=289078 RepID=A0A2X0N7M0_9BASI|nr:BZ3501_MvSof-1269-A2-R1_Chr9g10612 [Microbotryum saponariae]SDA00827.1 BZ3500_MvSof-1268-A1-R1_Chr9g10864 [Microbotryum saponariae]